MNKYLRDVVLYRGANGKLFSAEDFDTIDTCGLSIKDALAYLNVPCEFESDCSKALIPLDNEDMHNQILRELDCRGIESHTSITKNGFEIAFIEPYRQVEIEISQDKLLSDFKKYMRYNGIQNGLIISPWHKKDAIEILSQDLDIGFDKDREKIIMSMLTMYEMTRNNGQYLTTRSAYNALDFKTLHEGYNPRDDFLAFCESVSSFDKNGNVVNLDELIDSTIKLAEEFYKRNPEFIKEWSNIPRQYDKESNIQYDLSSNLSKKTGMESIIATDVSPENRMLFERSVKRLSLSKLNEAKEKSLISKLTDMGKSLYVKLSGKLFKSDKKTILYCAEGRSIKPSMCAKIVSDVEKRINDYTGEKYKVAFNYREQERKQRILSPTRNHDRECNSIGNNKIEIPNISF